MKKIVTILILILCQGAVVAKAQLSPSQKLYQLCKVWGYLKYHHPNKCTVKWNDLLMGKVDSVVASANNTDFNSILYNMCLQTGITTRPAVPTVILGDSARNYNTAWFQDPLLSPVIGNFLDSVQAHSISNTSGCLLRVNTYSDPNYSSYIDFRYDSIRNIAGFSYANMKHRMLVYFYYWNAVNYLFPQIAIADHHWDSTLVQLMPDMIAASNDSLFELTLAHVTSRIDDTHGSYSSKYFYKYFTGADITAQTIYRAKLKLAWIENKHVVIASDEPNIAMGDIITKIEGVDADTFFKRWEPYIAAGNAVSKYRNMYNMLLYGAYNAVKHLELTDATSTVKQVDVYTSTSFTLYNNWNLNQVDTLPEWGTTRCGYGYVHMGKLRQSSVASMYSDLRNKPAIVFDIRNYPQGTLWDIKPLLFPGPTISARFFEPDLTYPGYYYTRDDLYNFGNWSNSTPYTGKIFILVNEQTQSQAEYTAQALGTFPGAVIIGSQTAGADGNIVYLDFPNNIRTYWSGLGWYEADWYNPQRAGVRIDSIVNRTINGIRSGKDEILDKVDCKLLVQSVASGSPFAIRQQAHLLNISSAGNIPYRVDIINMLGQRIFSKEFSTQSASVSTTGFTPGIYVINVTDRNSKGKRMQVSIQ